MQRFTMPQDRQRWREPASSHWEPANRNISPYYNDYTSRHYTPYQSNVPYTGRSFNYWRDDSAMLNYPPRSYQSYRPDSHDERWRDDGRSWHGESSYSRRRRDSGPRSEQELWRERSPTRSQRPSRQHYSTHTPSPYLVSPTFRATSPPRESIAPLEHQKASQPQRKASLPEPDPSPSYLTLTQSPSEVLQDPASVRKLLVLDLNGTLLIRSQHSGARSRVSSGQKLRAVQPRPYMRSFREYLFSPKTKEWLDTMVWSSAQPHSVDDMVDKVFGPSKSELKAVWNRKSLGLSGDEYYRKSLTTKDLRKPWKLLPLDLSPEECDGGALPSSQSQLMHSAFTTLLLDDSPHKAILQPYSHVCIPEYDTVRRHRDLQSLQATREPKEGKRKKKDKSRVGVEEASVSHDGPSESIVAAREPFDATLLAVIGILEAVKVQSNLAGWVRKGGLWGRLERSAEDKSNASQPTTDKPLGGKTDQGIVVQTSNDERSASGPGVEVSLQTEMWFSNLTVMAYWITRGRETLERLGIDVSHGVTG